MTTQNSSVSCNLYTSTSKNIMISTCSSINIFFFFFYPGTTFHQPIRFWGQVYTVCGKFRFGTRVRCFYISYSPIISLWF